MRLQAGFFLSPIAMKKLLLKNGHVIDPSHGLDRALDLFLNEGRIDRIGAGLSAGDAEAIDLSGMVVAPGFIDMHVHLREPGNEEAETISTGTQAAAAGGFTAVACMPNTKPANDNIDTTQFILRQSNHGALIGVYPIAAVTKGQTGEELTDIAALKAHGVIGLSDDGRPVADSQLMREALERAGALHLPVIDHCEDPGLFRGGVMHEGSIAAKLSLRGIPSACEEIMVARNIILARLTRSSVHLAHMSTAGSMRLIREAKKDGVPVTAEVTPHHFTLTDEAFVRYGTNAKMNPPLRTAEDVRAVLDSIRDGTVDVIASDHAPHHADKKNVPPAQAAFGIIGLETSVSLGLDRLVNAGLISLSRFVDLYSLNAAAILGIPRGIAEGAEAHLTVFHPTREIKVDASQFFSKSRNTPFDGWNLKGCPMATIYRGAIVWRHAELR